MSVEQINLRALQGLLPTLEFIGIMILLCIGVWFGSLAVGAVIYKVRNKNFK